MRKTDNTVTRGKQTIVTREKQTIQSQEEKTIQSQEENNGHRKLKMEQNEP